MNDAVLEVVDDHVYLGSIISEKGRKKDLSQRIIDCKGAANEIVEICKTGGVNKLRLHFMKMLILLIHASKPSSNMDVKYGTTSQRKSS